MANINTATRKKQWLILGGVLAAAGAVAGGVVWYGQNSAAQKAAASAPAPPPNLTGLVNTQFTESVAGSALTQQQNKTAALENSLSQLKESGERQKQELEKKLDQMGQTLTQLQTQLAQSGKPAGPVTGGTGATGQADGRQAAGPGSPARWEITNPGSTGTGSVNPSQGQGFYPGTGTAGAVRTGGLSSIPFSYAVLQKPKYSLPWIPSGSFSEAVMIEGADANASVTGNQNTSPVVITLLGDVSMPNGRTYNLDQCRVTGEIFGDISSERGEVRTKNISCILKNGKHIDMGFDGHVSYQGKQGIRGKPVMRNGAVLANAGFAGFMSGVGDGFNKAATPVVGLGGAASVGAGDIFRQGAGGGASKAAESLSQYYIKRAEQYHPVIDIGAGNAVTVVFQKGFRLETIEDAEADKARKDAPADEARQTAATTASATTTTGATGSGVLNPDEVLRQASQLRLGDTVPQ